MISRTLSRRNSRKERTAGEYETSGGTPLASRRPGLEGVGIHSCFPLDEPVPATAGLGIFVLTVVVTREEPPCPASSAGVGGGGARPQETGIPAPGVVSVDVRRDSVFPAEEFMIGRVVSGAKQPGELGDTYDKERRCGNEVQGKNPDTNREILIPFEQGNAYESSPVQRARSPDTLLPAPDVSQKIPCGSTNLSHKSPYHTSPQKQMRTPA